VFGPGIKDWITKKGNAALVVFNSALKGSQSHEAVF